MENFIKEYLPELIISALYLILAAVFPTLKGWFKTMETTTYILLTIISCFIVFDIWLIGYAIRKKGENKKLHNELNSDDKLIPHFGMLWSNNNQPYCPIDKVVMSRLRYAPNGNWVTCPKCHQDFPLIDDEAKNITFKEMVKILQRYR